MGKIKLLVVDDNLEIVKMIERYFYSSEDIGVLFTAHDGIDGLEKIIKFRKEYDLIILDLVMPNKDGIYVLEEMKRLGINKKVIVSTSSNAPDMISKACEMGACYYLLKPYDMYDLSKRIKDVLSDCNKEHKNAPDLQIEVAKILHDLGMPSHINGYHYIKMAIILIYNNPKLANSITKELYPKIAIEFDTTISRVERSIRHSIEVSFGRGDWNIMIEFFGNSISVLKAKPTNSEFIITIVEKLKSEKSNLKYYIEAFLLFAVLVA